MNKLIISDLYDKYKDNKFHIRNNLDQNASIYIDNRKDNYIIQTKIYPIKKFLIYFIKSILDFLFSKISMIKLITNKEIKCITSIFSMKKVMYIIYFVCCFIIESIINFVYKKASLDKDNIQQILNNELLFKCSDINTIDCYPLISEDDELLYKESFIEKISIDLLLIDKDVKFREQALKLLEGSIDNIFDYENDKIKKQEDIDKLIIDFAKEIDKLVIYIFNKKKDSNFIDKLFNISINLRMLISYLVASCIFRIIKITFHLINDLQISQNNESIIYVAIHTFFTKNKIENSEILYKKLLNYLNNEIVRNEQHNELHN